ncbi:hypothetical protein [Phaeobacter italicus]|jgi:hypothetical protein|uniref:hypothetical protein n=1 Tax=Phaeobacter italicus TaxID=481446 RepID=UPI002FDD2EA8
MKMLKSFALAAALAATATVSAVAEALPIDKAVIVEYLEFDLVDGANPDEFLRETLAMDAVLEGYDGFVARHLAKNNDGSWVEVVYWTSLEDAEAALPRFVEDPRTKGFLALVDGDSLSVKYSNLFEF